MKNNLLGKIGTAVLALCATWAVQAQVVYTDVDPDQVLKAVDTDAYPLDLNGDFIPDFVIAAATEEIPAGGIFNINSVGVAISPLNDNAVVGYVQTIFSEDFLMTNALTSGSDIDGSLTFQDTASKSAYPGLGLGVDLTFATENEQLGEFPGKYSHYVGLKLVVGGNTHYGWVRMTVVGDCSEGTIYDYAYESTPDVAIKAGDTGSEIISSVETIEEADLIVFADQQALNLNVINNTEPLGFSVYSLTGKLMHSGSVVQNTSIETSAWAKGIYLVQVDAKGTSLTKKVVVQ